MNTSSHLPSNPKGSVTLVGAGPGDPELLTLKAVRVIASATVILVDDLVNAEVLSHASPSARIIYVGKRGGCKSTPQAFIEKMMIAEAKSGECVVRLKGGDPLIFGRSGEEMAALKKAGITCTVVNGITAGLAAANSLQMPLTHRDYAHGVVFVTGHAAPGDADTDWISLGKMAIELKLTLVIYMGVSHAEEIQTGLLTHCPASMPVALIQNASTAQERCVKTQLESLARAIEQYALKSPLIMVIGDVAKLANAAFATAISGAQDGYNSQLVA